MQRLRLVDEIGAYSFVQAVQGALALPAPKPIVPWWQVLQVNRDAPVSLVNAAYRALAKELHESGGGDDQLRALNEAVSAARIEKSVPSQVGDQS